MKIGEVAGIWRYPMKSLRGEALATTTLEADGMPGDRTRALYVRAGHARVGKPYRGKEDERLHLLGARGEAVAAAAARGVTLEERCDGRFFDDAPVSLLVASWLAELREAVGYAVEPLRFRPNFYLTAAPGFALREAALVDAELTLGTARLRVRGPIPRCVVPTYDLDTGQSDPRVLAFIAQHRANEMGIYADVVEPGHIALGDTATLLERAATSES